MRFFIPKPLETFSDWLASHYFSEYQIIHKFQLKTSGDGRQFYQYGTPKPPIIILRVHVDESDSGVHVKLEVIDRPGNNKEVIFDFMHTLTLCALTDPCLKSSSLPPTSVTTFGIVHNIDTSDFNEGDRI